MRGSILPCYSIVYWIILYYVISYYAQHITRTHKQHGMGPHSPDPDEKSAPPDEAEFAMQLPGLLAPQTPKTTMGLRIRMPPRTSFLIHDFSSQIAAERCVRQYVGERSVQLRSVLPSEFPLGSPHPLVAPSAGCRAAARATLVHLARAHTLAGSIF